LAWWVVSCVPSATAQQTILTSKHNLSATGPGPVHAITEQRVCIFCHTPHGARDVAPLWNRRDSTAAYLPYNSPTLKAQVGQPTGASKLCLSCHDGTIALGDLVNEGYRISMTGGDMMPAGDSLIGTDLRDDHPVSFLYSDSQARNGSALSAPSSWDRHIKLDAQGEMQCTTCHDPHDDQWGNFLVASNQNAFLCQQCHNQPFFNTTSHATSPRQWNGAGRDPWPQTDYPDVQSNACMNCHRSHHADGQSELLPDAREEENCFVCHNGNVATANLQAVFRKFYRHPVEQTQGVHRDGESPLAAVDHVECADCHNPHRAHSAPADAPAVKGVLEGVSGLDLSGATLPESMFEYQICFKCHGQDTAPTPLNSISRQVTTYNTRMEFAPASASFHPVASAGRNGDVPSLIAPLTPASFIYCSDCHGNDGANAGNGLAGPHGSSFEFMLVREYRTGDNISESASAYALCYGCHSRTSILNDESFRFHRKHVVDARSSCATCHDGHGIDMGKGNPVNNAHLINFDVSVVQPASGSGVLEYRSLGSRAGQCTLTCHGRLHNAETY
jgi:predicted CXXCH cytochrome family protein